LLARTQLACAEQAFFQGYIWRSAQLVFQLEERHPDFHAHRSPSDAFFDQTRGGANCQRVENFRLFSTAFSDGCFKE
jgi:hypothetical protein